MSYRIPRFLTVIMLVAAAATSLAAQRDVVKRELPYLAAPAAFERAKAVQRLAKVKGDIAADLRVAYKFSGNPQQKLGLLQVAQARGEDALLQAAVTALSDKDATLAAVARDYLLQLPIDKLSPDVSKLSDEQAAAWNAFHDFRVRRDIARSLLEAYMLPGKYFGQFEKLRELDGERLDTELMAVATCDPEFIEPLQRAARDIVERDSGSTQAFQSAWKDLEFALDAFPPACKYMRYMQKTVEFNRLMRRTSTSSFLSALEIGVGVRTAAIRALAQSKRGADVAPMLNLLYRTLLSQIPAPEYANTLDLDNLRQEIELTLARFGEPRLLKARIATLRRQIDRVRNPRSNVNMAASARPDLVAMNQIAHLLLRSGDIEGAEEEWASAVQTTLQMMRETDGRNRSSLTSYLAAVYYNLACTQSLQLKLSKGLQSLKESVRYGYQDFQWMLKDGDLASVREFDGFTDWFKNVAPPSIADRLDRDS